VLNTTGDGYWPDRTGPAGIFSFSFPNGLVTRRRTGMHQTSRLMHRKDAIPHAFERPLVGVFNQPARRPERTLLT
jgi:hypothetical protein